MDIVYVARRSLAGVGVEDVQNFTGARWVPVRYILVFFLFVLPT